MKRTLIIASVAFGLISLVVLYLGFDLSSHTDKRSTASLSDVGDVSVPELVRLKIPAIEVDAPIGKVGVTSNGAMDVPKGPADAAWFEFGPRPGEVGSAVIAGHFGWKNGIPAVFDNLHKLQPGDRIHVLDDRGSTATFIVRELKVYSENDEALEVFYSNDGKSHLNLITCEGTWNKQKKSYSDRLVVFADKEI